MKPSAARCFDPPVGNFSSASEVISIRARTCADFPGGDLMESEFDRRFYGSQATTERMDFLPGHAGNIAQWLGACGDTFESSLPTTLAWIVGTSVILGFLTAMLIVAIAITV
jgi:hypothetical protein